MAASFHDPRTKQQIRDALHDYLFTKAEKRFQDRLERLIIRNTAMQGYTHMSFMYQGVMYSCDTKTPPRTVRRLSPALTGEMKEYLAEYQDFSKYEVPAVMSYIIGVLNASNDFCDYYRCLPEAIHYVLRDILGHCPCIHRRMTDQEVADLLQKNQEPLNLLKQRMVINLII